MFGLTRTDSRRKVHAPGKQEQRTPEQEIAYFHQLEAERQRVEQQQPIQERRRTVSENERLWRQRS